MQTQLVAQTGLYPGLLNGNFLIYGLQGALRDLVNYNGTGNTKSLTDLGIEMDKSGNGKMSLNQTTFNSLTASKISDGFAFMGSTTTGFGGLSAELSSFSDPILGSIQAQQAGLIPPTRA